MTNPTINPDLLFRGTPTAVIAVNGMPLKKALKAEPRLAYAGTAPVELSRKVRHKKPRGTSIFVPASTALGVVEAVRAGESLRSSELRTAIRQIERLRMVQSNLVDVTQKDLRDLHTLLRQRKTAKVNQRRSRERPVFEVPMSVSAAVIQASDNPLPDIVGEALRSVHAQMGGLIETAAQVMVHQVPELEARLRRDGVLV